MSKIRSALLALAIIAGFSPAIAQVPPPVPALPDTQRIGTFSITASTCACSVPFAFFADQTDYQNWVKVYVNGAQVQYNDPVFGWKITSPTGVIGLIPQPITDAILTFNTAQTGTVQIVGARRPRRVTQFQEGRGVAARDLNEALTDIVAQNRENWDLAGSALHGIPGANYGAVPSNCPNAGLGFDSTGLNFVCTAGGLTGISGYIAAVVAATPATVLPNSPVYANGTAGVGATLTAGSNAALTIDGVTLVAGNRVLVKDQASAFQNGVYNVTQVGSGSTPYILTRVTDFDQTAEMIASTAVVVTGGTNGQSSGWLLQAAVPTIGTSPVTWIQFVVPPTAPSFSARPVFNITNAPYNAKCDYNASSTAAMASGSSTLTVGSVLFASGDVGKYIMVAGAGTSGALLATTIASYVSPTSVVLSAANASGGAISGQIMEFGTDDTASIQSAINAAAAALGTVYFHGACLVSRLNLTNLSNLNLVGETSLAAALYPLQNASYGTSSGHVLDMSGTSFVTIENLRIGAYYSPVQPTTGIFWAQTAANGSNRNRIRNVYVSAQFKYAAFYDYGVPSSDIISSDFYNYTPGVNGLAPMVLTNTNLNSLTSAFTTVSTPGTTSTSDLHFFDCEWHKFSGTGAQNSTITLDSVTNIGFFGGVASGGATAYVFYYGTSLHITWLNVTFETESQPVTPIYGHYKQTGTVTDMSDFQSSYILGGGGGKFNVSATPTNQVSNAF